MNYIKVKMFDGQGVKGRAYTYKSAVEVNVGDLVTADFGGIEKVLQVVETGVPESEAEGGKFEIKTIIGLATEQEAQEMQTGESINFEVTEEILPVIKINYEQVKGALTATLQKYSNLVVTAETLSGCKGTQKELASLRIKIDNYRKEKKKDMSAPIVDFENQCKELVELVEQVEKPIKVGISIFDDKKKDTKRSEAEAIITAVVQKEGLTEKYAAKLDVLDKYCNLTAKESDVRQDVEQRAFALKVEQDREQELIDIIKDAIEMENGRLTKKLSLQDFDRLIKAGAATKEVLADIRQKADAIYEAEHPAPKVEESKPVVEEAPQEMPQTFTAPETVFLPQEEPEQCYMDIHCVGTLEQLKAALEAVRGLGVVCKVTNQGTL